MIAGLRQQNNDGAVGFDDGGKVTFAAHLRCLLATPLNHDVPRPARVAADGMAGDVFLFTECGFDMRAQV
jgi:hypothetical protein